MNINKETVFMSDSILDKIDLNRLSDLDYISAGEISSHSVNVVMSIDNVNYTFGLSRVLCSNYPVLYLIASPKHVGLLLSAGHIKIKHLICDDLKIEKYKNVCKIHSFSQMENGYYKCEIVSID